MKKPDLLVLVAVWQFIAAAIAFFGIVAIALFAFPAVLGYWDGYGRFAPGYYNGPGTNAAVFGLSVAIFVLVCYMGLAIAGGIGLALSKPREWARIVSIVQSALVLVSFPVGTTIGILSIIYLTRAEVRDYFNPPKGPPATPAI